MHHQLPTCGIVFYYYSSCSKKGLHLCPISCVRPSRSARSTRQYQTSPIVNCFCCTTTYHIDRLQNQYLPLSKAHTTNCVFKIYVFKGMAFDLYRDIYTSKLHGFNITYSSSSCNNRHRAAVSRFITKKKSFFGHLIICKLSCVRLFKSVINWCKTPSPWCLIALLKDLQAFTKQRWGTWKTIIIERFLDNATMSPFLMSKVVAYQMAILYGINYLVIV